MYARHGDDARPTARHRPVGPDSEASVTSRIPRSRRSRTTPASPAAASPAGRRARRRPRSSSPRRAAALRNREIPFNSSSYGKLTAGRSHKRSPSRPSFRSHTPDLAILAISRPVTPLTRCAHQPRFPTGIRQRQWIRPNRSIVLVRSRSTKTSSNAKLRSASHSCRRLEPASSGKSYAGHWSSISSASRSWGA